MFSVQIYESGIFLWLFRKTIYLHTQFNSLRPRQNGRHFADDTLKRLLLNENVSILIKISLKFVPFNNIPALDQIMAWRRPSDKPLSELMIVRLPKHICVTRPQWVKSLHKFLLCFDHLFVVMVCNEWQFLQYFYFQYSIMLNAETSKLQGTEGSKLGE